MDIFATTLLNERIIYCIVNLNEVVKQLQYGRSKILDECRNLQISVKQKENRNPQEFNFLNLLYFEVVSIVFLCPNDNVS